MSELAKCPQCGCQVVPKSDNSCGVCGATFPADVAEHARKAGAEHLSAVRGEREARQKRVELLQECEKCGGSNIWKTVGVMAPEGRCLDCDPPPQDASEQVAEWMKQVENDVADTAHYISQLEHIGPAGRVAVPLLKRVYAKYGTRDFPGCAAKDALRTFEQLNKPPADAGRSTKTSHSREKSQCFIATACCGNPEAAEVLALRQYRDSVLLCSEIGRVIVRVYCAVSPPIATCISRCAALRSLLLHALVRPLACLARSRTNRVKGASDA